VVSEEHNTFGQLKEELSSRLFDIGLRGIETPRAYFRVAMGEKPDLRVFVCVCFHHSDCDMFEHVKLMSIWVGKQLSCKIWPRLEQRFEGEAGVRSGL
jgi:hypothetical protein